MKQITDTTLYMMKILLKYTDNNCTTKYKTKPINQLKNDDDDEEEEEEEKEEEE